MRYDIRIIFRLIFHRGGSSALVVLQIAIALSVLANAAWIVHQRSVELASPSGIDERNIFVIESTAYEASFSYEAMMHEDLAYIRAFPGVIAASPINAVAFSQAGQMAHIWTTPDHHGPGETVNALSADAQGLRVLGVHLVAGKEFSSSEILPALTLNNMTDFVPSVIVTKAASRQLFGTDTAVGKVVYNSLGTPATIVGVVDDMVGSATWGLKDPKEVMFFPRLPGLDDFYYIVRTKPGERDSIMAGVAQHLGGSQQGRAIKFARPLELYKRQMQLNDTSTRAFLLASTALVLIVTSFGVYGLVAAQIRGRIRQIGIRRALGAERADVITEALIESGILCLTGIVLGVMLSLAVSRWLAQRYELPALDLVYLVGGALVLALLSQLAAWRPALAASKIAPSIAARTI